MERIDALTAMRQAQADSGTYMVSPEQAARRAREESLADYKIFKEAVEKDTVLTKSEFERYQKLYDHTLAQRAREGKLSKDEELELNDLSNEFREKINMYRPVHIVDDFTRQELYELPPIFRRPQALHTEQDTELMAIYTNLNDGEGKSGPINDAKRDEATRLLSNAINRNQDVEALKSEMERFETIARNFHKTVLGDDPFAPSITREQAVQQQLQSAKSTKEVAEDTPDDDFEF